MLQKSQRTGNGTSLDTETKGRYCAHAIASFHILFAGLVCASPATLVSAALSRA